MQVILKMNPVATGVVLEAPAAAARARRSLAAAGLGRLATSSPAIFPARSARRRRLRPRLRPAQLGRSPRGEDPGALSGRDGRRRAPAGGRDARARRRPPEVAQVHDLEMLVFTDGRERTAAEYRALLEASGFRLRRITPRPAAPASSKPSRSAAAPRRGGQGRLHTETRE